MSEIDLYYGRDSHKGSCQATFYPSSERGEYAFGIATIALKAGTVVLLALFIFKSARDAMAGSELFGRIVIFPIHRKTLVALAILQALSTLLKSWQFIFSSPEAGSANAIVLAQVGFSRGLRHMLIEGIMALLVSPGCGTKALRRCTKFGMGWGLLVGIFWGYCVYAHHKQFNRNHSHKDDTSKILNLFFWMFLCITYGTLWLAPARYARAIEKIQGCLGLSQDRGAIVPRPAARFYACYWWVHYTLCTISAWLLWSQNDAGFCITYFNDLLFLLIFDTPFTYWCFLLEARWWCDVNSSTTRFDKYCCATKCAPYLCCEAKHDDQCRPSSNVGGPEVGGSKVAAEAPDGPSFFPKIRSFRQPRQISGRITLTAKEQQDINNPLAGLAWNGNLGASAAEAIDQLGNFRQRGSSINYDEEHENVHEHREGRQLSTKKNSHKRPVSIPASKVVPLLNFTRVKVLSSKLLGSGSTARVYEGRWCGRKCATKVLFSMDLKRADINRCCEEAKLLHSLDSPHVLRLYGIAVLPPSLCLVLELCSAGSLWDVLYARQGRRGSKGPPGSKSWQGSSSSRSPSFDSSVRPGSVGRSRGTFVQDRRSSGQTHDTKRAMPRKSGSGPIPGMDLMGADCTVGNRDSYAFELDSTYLRRIDVALNAAKGVAAVHELLGGGGYAHNDIKSPNFLCNELDQEGDYRQIEVKVSFPFFVYYAAAYKFFPQFSFGPHSVDPFA
jgi:hypothetical protein